MKTQARARQALSAVGWNTGFNVFRDLLQFAVMLVLVRRLSAEAYGQFAIVTSVMGFIAVFSYNQFIAYIVQVSDDAEVHYQDQFTAGAAMALVLFAAANVVAWLLGKAGSPGEVAPLLHVMSLSFLLAFPCDFRIKLLEREMNWKRLRLLHAGGLVASAILAIAMAWAGAGVYALLVPSLLVNIPFTVDLWLAVGWRPDWTWSWATYKAAWEFGLTRIGSGITGSGRQVLEASMLAIALGVSGLGIFNRAIGLAQMFCQKFAFQLLYAIYPSLTRMESDDVARVNGLLFQTVAWVVIPISTIFAALSTPVVLYIYGDRWRDVAYILPMAMFCGAVAALAETANTLLLSRQRPKLCLVADSVALVGTFALLMWALPLGAITYLAGLTALRGLILATTTYGLCRLRALQRGALPIALLQAATASLLGYGVCEAWRRSAGVDIGEFWIATLYGLLFLTIYLSALRVLFPQSFGHISRRLPWPRRPVVPNWSPRIS